MSRADIQLPQARGFLKTGRRDRWWSKPVAILLILGAFIVYGTWAAFQGEHYHYGQDGANYLSPFYSPVLWDAPGTQSGHAWFGDKPGWWPAWLIFSPALLILWAPGGFRVTCYYYRGAYYKAFWGDPPACAVGEPGFRGTRYRGERKLPLVLQNVHRYFMYLALVFMVILSYDAWSAMWFATEDGGKRFGIGVGTIVLTVNVILLGGYTFGCHSLRHVVGGRLDRLAGRKVQKKTYDCVSCLNRGHGVWAMSSLVWVGLADVYVRLCSAGVLTDLRLF